MRCRNLGATFPLWLLNAVALVFLQQETHKRLMWYYSFPYFSKLLLMKCARYYYYYFEKLILIQSQKRSDNFDNYLFDNFEKKTITFMRCRSKN